MAPVGAAGRGDARVVARRWRRRGHRHRHRAASDGAAPAPGGAPVDDRRHAGRSGRAAMNGDRGSATVLVLVAATLVGIAATVSVLTTLAVTARHHAAAAAD